MPVRISVWNSRELLATILAIRQAPTEMQKQIRQQTKTITSEEWKRAMGEHASTVNAARVTSRVLVQTARVAVSNQNVRLSSATVGRRLKGGLEPKVHYYALEFGANPDTRTTYTATSRKGRKFTVHQRHTARQLPRRLKAGWVFGPAVADMVPRIAALWVQTTVRVIAEAFEGKRGG